MFSCKLLLLLLLFRWLTAAACFVRQRLGAASSPGGRGRRLAAAGPFYRGQMDRPAGQGQEGCGWCLAARPATILLLRPPEHQEL